jgi:hypothetical protein
MRRHSLSRLALVPILALLIAPICASPLFADVWIDIDMTYTRTFTDGAGVQRSMALDKISVKSDGDVAMARFSLLVDGNRRYVTYSLYKLKNVMISSYLTAQDRIDVLWVQAAREAARLKRPAGNREQFWVMRFANETLYGRPGKAGQTSTVGADPFSFAALSFDPLKLPAVASAVKNSDNENAQAAMKLLGKIFKGKLGARCVKKTIETLKCNAQCTAGQDGACPCECMGMPCCSDCTKTTETVREYNVEGEASAGIGMN